MYKKKEIQWIYKQIFLRYNYFKVENTFFGVMQEQEENFSCKKQSLIQVSGINSRNKRGYKKLSYWSRRLDFSLLLVNELMFMFQGEKYWLRGNKRRLCSIFYIKKSRQFEEETLPVLYIKLEASVDIIKSRATCFYGFISVAIINMVSFESLQVLKYLTFARIWNVN